MVVHKEGETKMNKRICLVVPVLVLSAWLLAATPKPTAPTAVPVKPTAPAAVPVKPAAPAAKPVAEPNKPAAPAAKELKPAEPAKPTAPAAAAGAFADEAERISYAFGTKIAEVFSAGGIKLNTAVFMRGLEDATAGKALVLTAEEIERAMEDYRKRIVAVRQQQLEKQSQENLRVGRAFLEANKTKAGVTVLASGLQYKVLKEGVGRSPGVGDQVKVHYRGTLIDGTEFDSSYTRGEPTVLGLDAVIPGWTEALELMKPGAKWQLFIPPELAYGQRPMPKVGPNSVLIFEVELLEVLPQPAPGAEPEERPGAGPGAQPEPQRQTPPPRAPK